MSEEKKEVDVHDLKPTKDAKGGGKHGHSHREGGGHNPGAAGIDTAGRGKHHQR